MGFKAFSFPQAPRPLWGEPIEKLGATSEKAYFCCIFCVFGCGTAQTPTITSFTPTSGSSGTEVSITGTNFSSAIKAAAFGADAIASRGIAGDNFTIVSSTEIKVTVPSLASFGTGKIALWTDTTGSSTRYVSTADFTVGPPSQNDQNQPPAFSVGGFGPTFAAAGTTINISGSGFDQAVSGVEFLGFTSNVGIPAASFSVVSASEIAAVVPSGLSDSDSYYIKVIKGSVSAQSTNTFILNATAPEPTIQTPALPVPVNGVWAFLLMIISFLAAASLVVRRGDAWA